MKNRIVTSFLIALFMAMEISFSFAQTVVNVLPGTGTLENAIKSSNSGDILQLTGGTEYFLSASASTFGTIIKPITIRVNPSTSEKAIIRLSPAASPTKKFYFFTVKDGGALTLKGLDIHGIAKDTAVASSMLVFDAQPAPQNARFGNFRFENCAFHDFKDYIINGMKDDYARGSIQDSVFINKVIVYNAKHFLQYKHVSLRHIEMTNSTIYNLNGMALKIGKIGYRCVLLNPTKPYIPLSDSTITPTGFIDHCTMDNLGDIHGHIQVDNAFHTLKVSNCIISNQQQWNQPALYFLEPMTDKVIAVENTNFWKCGPPNELVGGYQWIGYEFKDSMNFNPEYKNAAVGDFTLPENSPLLKAATDGGPIGDLRWISNTTFIRKIVDKKEIESRSYPNPFSGITNIIFDVKAVNLVTVILFNANGMRIATLLNEQKQIGNYILKWNATSYPSGIYFYQLKIGAYIETKKMIFRK